MGKTVPRALEDNYSKDPKGWHGSMQEPTATVQCLVWTFPHFQVDMEPSSSTTVAIWFPREAIVRCEQCLGNPGGCSIWNGMLVAKGSSKTTWRDLKWRKGSAWFLSALTSQAAGSHWEVKVPGYPSSFAEDAVKTLGSPLIVGILLWYGTHPRMCWETRSPLSRAVRNVHLQTPWEC